MLWASEREALSIQAADLHWQNFLLHLAPLSELQQHLNVPSTSLDVKSIMYITPTDQSIAIEAFHVMEQSYTAPPKAYFFSKLYRLTFAQAFKLANDTLTLANMTIETENQVTFAEKLKQAQIRYSKEQEELEQKRLLQLLEEQKINEEQRKIIEEKKKAYQEGMQNSTYNRADKAKRMAMLKQAYNANN